MLWRVGRVGVCARVLRARAARSVAVEVDRFGTRGHPAVRIDDAMNDGPFPFFLLSKLSFFLPSRLFFFSKLFKILIEINILLLL